MVVALELGMGMVDLEGIMEVVSAVLVVSAILVVSERMEVVSERMEVVSATKGLERTTLDLEGTIVVSAILVVSERTIMPADLERTMAVSEPATRVLAPMADLEGILGGLEPVVASAQILEDLVPITPTRPEQVSDLEGIMAMADLGPTIPVSEPITAGLEGIRPARVSVSGIPIIMLV